MTGSVGIDVFNVDFDRSTGETLVGWPAVAQSIREGLLTDFGSRVMREYFGSLVPRSLGESATPDVLLSLSASIASFIDVFEPRFRVSKAVPVGVDRLGVVQVEIHGEYVPRALLGDEAGAGLQQVVVKLSGANFEVIT